MPTRKPIIGITPSPMEDTQAHGTFRRYAAATTYTEAIEAAGGVPVVIPPQSGNIAEIIAVVDGLLISGGGDIRPDLYGDSEVHDATSGIHDLRDELEIALVREATSRDIPMLCICRGIQVLNVALGGTIIQDIAAQYSTEIEHRQQENGIRKEDPSHTVTLTPGSLLARTYEADEISVNSFHHQAIRDLAPELEINGVSTDEVVEGVSHPGSSWILGVQWHPEMMFRDHPEHLKPFAALVAEAAKKADPLPV
ncbi:MAG: gamma-glutamyl-gamma-aminobutyrate hydrolase family protein [Chloroflexota bacterium]|nr:gamma-glutamyl-gamma-aminobutyrate hydrolase family protein [Chloroflexota bacterium]